MSVNEELNLILVFSWPCYHILAMICSGSIVTGATQNCLDLRELSRKTPGGYLCKRPKEGENKNFENKIKASRNSRENIKHLKMALFCSIMNHSQKSKIISTIVSAFMRENFLQEIITICFCQESLFRLRQLLKKKISSGYLNVDLFS